MNDPQMHIVFLGAWIATGVHTWRSTSDSERCGFLGMVFGLSILIAGAFHDLVAATCAPFVCSVALCIRQDAKVRFRRRSLRAETPVQRESR